MLKKIIFSLLFLSTLIGAYAQHIPGSWKIIPMSGSTIGSIQDTPNMVYYISNGVLYGYDKENNENIYYAPGTKLSDSGIKLMKYNGDKKYLLLAYNSGNIDLIYDNGKVVNLPEIKDANLTTAKTINDVQFGTDRIYIATAFGIVIFNDKDHYVIESGIYNENIPQILELGDYILLWYKDSDGKYKVAYSLKNDRHNSLTKFTKTAIEVGYANILPLSDTALLTFASGNVSKVNFNPSGEKVLTIDSPAVVSGTGGKALYKYKNGFYVAGTNGFYLIDNDGNSAGKQNFPTEYGSQTLSFWDGPSSFWGADANGIANYALSEGAVTVLSDKYFPKSSRQFKTWYSANHPNGKEVYFNEVGLTEIHPGSNSNSSTVNLLLQTESYNWETGEIEQKYPTDKNGKMLNGGPGRIIFDQTDPSYMYWANNQLGFYVLKDRTLHYVYDSSNSPVWRAWRAFTYDVTFDNNGNLWVTMWRDYASNDKSKVAPVKVIPKEYLKILKENPEELTKLDDNGQYKYWLQPEWTGGLYGWCDSKLIFSSRSNKGIALNGGWGCAVVGVDTKGTTSVDDDEYVLYSGFRDQDGTVTNTVRKTWMVEDKNGHIWIGTDAGIFVVEDYDKIADGSSNYLETVRPKVARNDGTSYADYLLSSDFILNIAVDSNNRKWIATTTSGLYCVSADGSEIIYEFNKDNSPLVSNVVTMVACDPNSNDVLIGTPEGLFVYSSDSAPAKDDYSEVYAVPNPVRPDYTGWITINGLMDNSLVKITDSHGHTIWEGRSEGGMAIWDGCDGNGNRVRTGVYMVMASQNENGNSGGVVTKIVVVN